MMSYSTAAVFVFTTLAVLIGSTESFSKESFCAARCSYGRGGNLCQCNAFHFAGKRADIADPEVRGLPRDQAEAGWETGMQSQEPFHEYASEKSTGGQDIRKLTKNARNLQKIFAKIFPQRFDAMDEPNEVRRRRNTKLRRQLGLSFQ
ncbi:uncharacterized protein LOC121385261 [Gigantopelta aegis]|uniref:uncharacterized protein LOC121385261 n=1 Tax=Gigantopelta aegis TaxID=1735272 RepID=UPI001B88B327|nr:uncharacterized protein LOC121385261 [Gigantopelta aegis]